MHIEISNLCAFAAIVLSIYEDLKEQKIRWLPIVCCILAGLLAEFVYGALQWQEVIYGVFPGMISLFVSKICGDCMGGGDILLILCVGVLCGWKFCLKFLCVSAVCIFSFSVVMLLLKRIHRKSRIPCVPFLCAGYIGAWLL